jgi:hypothetical protein
MSNCILAYPDRTLAAAATLSGGSWLTGELSLQSLKDADPKKVARTTNLNTNSTKFSIDLGAVMDIRCVYLLGHNASKPASVRIRAGAVSNFSDNLYDQTLPFYFTLYPQGGLPWGHPDAWDGGTMPDDLIDNFPKQLLAVLTSDYSLQVRYLQFDVSDAGNPAGFFQLGRCFVAPAWQPSRNLLPTATFGLETATTSVESRGGSDFYDVRAYRRITNFTLSLNAAQGLAQVFEMQRRLGIHDELLFVRDPDDATMVEQLRSFLCTMRELSPIENPYCDRSTAAYRLREKL